ncbi:unnamed protein product [Rotaria sordida]|uniref:RING-type domain-containing protein n=1 Tax=Rotaria sordida TaxID=392033 RepID=A0A819I5T4_9BILA|nr:unnamed protein product [Rotaria sordida]CAF3908209.1 unnamed protein product [Rotaria sordida]
MAGPIVYSICRQVVITNDDKRNFIQYMCGHCIHRVCFYRWNEYNYRICHKCKLISWVIYDGSSEPKCMCKACRTSRWPYIRSLSCSLYSIITGSNELHMEDVRSYENGIIYDFGDDHNVFLIYCSNICSSGGEYGLFVHNEVKRGLLDKRRHSSGFDNPPEMYFMNIASTQLRSYYHRGHIFNEHN